MSAKAQLSDLISAWGRRYLTAAFDFEIPRTVASINEELVSNQLLFIPAYAALMQRQGSVSPLPRIRAFLRNQTPDNPRHLLSIHLAEGDPFEVRLLASAIEDVDLEDAMDLINFKYLSIRRADGYSWTKKRVAAAQSALLSDLTYDGEELTLEMDDYCPDKKTLCFYVRQTLPPLTGFVRASSILSKDPHVHQALPFWLAQSPSFKVRFMVAGLPYIDKKTSALLARDANNSVRLRLASNTSAIPFLTDRTIGAILQVAATSKGQLASPRRLARGFRNILDTYLDRAGDEERLIARQAVSARLGKFPHLNAVFSKVANALEKEVLTDDDDDLLQWLKGQIDHRSDSLSDRASPAHLNGRRVQQ